MGSACGGRSSYASGGAELYASLEIEGTTYEIGFEAVRRALGDIQGQVLLDFGCGAGRSAGFLRSLGAGRVYGVDRDQDMIGKALARRLDGVVFAHADEVIPLPDESVDGAVSLNVFIELRSLAEMGRACREVASTLRQAGLTVTAIGYPMPRDPSAWSTDEALLSPCIVLTAVKA